MIHLKIFYLLLVSICICSQGSASTDSNFVETKLTLHTTTGDIYGTLTTPISFNKIPIAVLIAGSGPTDRNGNNPYAMNAGLQKLAYALVENNIASLRFDKRGIGESNKAMISESALRFTDYINDVKDWINLMKSDKRFSKLIVIGHSEGSLIGMIAATKADMFVSIAGAGRSADIILKEQLSKQPQEVQDETFPLIDSLKACKLVTDFDPKLASLFRASIQPYMISWFMYDPQIEIKKLTIPVLIIQGTNDIQVTVEDAKLLAAAYPKAKLELITNMNHIFRIVTGDVSTNIATYSKASLPISDKLVTGIVSFIQESR